MPVPKKIQGTLKMRKALVRKALKNAIEAETPRALTSEDELRALLVSRFNQEQSVHTDMVGRLRDLSAAEEAENEARSALMRETAIALVAVAAGPLSGAVTAGLNVAAQAATEAVGYSVGAAFVLMNAYNSLPDKAADTVEEKLDEARREGHKSVADTEDAAVHAVMRGFAEQRSRMCNALLVPDVVNTETGEKEENKLLEEVMDKAIEEYSQMVDELIAERESNGEFADDEAKEEAIKALYGDGLLTQHMINAVEAVRVEILLQYDKSVKAYLEKIGPSVGLSENNVAMAELVVLGQMSCKLKDDEVFIASEEDGKLEVNPAIFDKKITDPGRQGVTGRSLQQILEVHAASKPSHLLSLLEGDFPGMAAHAKSSDYRVNTKDKRVHMLAAIRIATCEVRRVAGHNRIDMMTQEQKEEVVSNLLRVALTTKEFASHKDNPMLQALIHFKPLAEMVDGLEPAVLERIFVAQTAVVEIHRSVDHHDRATVVHRNPMEAGPRGGRAAKAESARKAKKAEKAREAEEVAKQVEAADVDGELGWAKNPLVAAEMQKTAEAAEVARAVETADFGDPWKENPLAVTEGSKTASASRAAPAWASSRGDRPTLDDAASVVSDASSQAMTPRSPRGGGVRVIRSHDSGGSSTPSGPRR